MDMTDDHDDDSFCKGAMDMNMDGFSSMFDDDPMCINFLFRTWTLDNRTKFAFACIGSCLMGLSVEFLTRSRRLLKEMPLLVVLKLSEMNLVFEIVLTK